MLRSTSTPVEEPAADSLPTIAENGRGRIRWLFDRKWARLGSLPSAAIGLGVLLLLGGCLRTNAPTLSASSGLTASQIVDQFAVESEPARRAPAEIAGVVAESRIAIPDPLELAANDMSISTTPPGNALVARTVKSFLDVGYRGSIEERHVTYDVAFAELCSGATDLIMVDQRPTPHELAECAGAASDFMVLTVARDRIVLVAHPDNFWFGQVSASDLGSVLVASSWRDIDDQWPRRPIQKLVPGIDSTEMDSIMLATLSAGGSGIDRFNLPATSSEPNAAQRLDAVAGNPEAVAFMALGDVRLSALDFVIRPLDGRDPLAAGPYPAERSLYLVVPTSELVTRPELSGYIGHVLNRIESSGPLVNLAPPSDAIQIRQDFVNDLEDLQDDVDATPLLTIESGS